ncbi:hypothetical protein Tco_1035732 [Tanacetum coccineum]
MRTGAAEKILTYVFEISGAWPLSGLAVQLFAAVTHVMDLNAFIRTADPCKVRVVERPRAENEGPIVTVAKHRTVTLLPTSWVPEGLPVASHPPKRLRVDYGTTGGSVTEGKSPSVLNMLLQDSRLTVEQGVPALPTLPFITSYVTASPLEEGEDRTDSVTGPSFKDKSAPHPSVFGSSSSSEKTDRTLSLFTGRSGSGFDAGSIRAEESVGAGSEEIYVPECRCPRAREESAAVTQLRAQVSGLEATENSLRGEVASAKDRNTLLEQECDSLKLKVTDLESAIVDKDHKLSELGSVSLIEFRTKVHELEVSSTDLREKLEMYEELLKQLEEYQDKLMEPLRTRLAEIDTDFTRCCMRFQENFHPHLLNVIAGRRWLLTHGMKLLVVKCLNSNEYMEALGHAFGRAIEKGMQEGLAAGIEHGQAGRAVDYGMQEGLAAGYEHGVAGTSFSAFMSYNPETAEGDYLDAVRALEEADFPLVRLLKSKKDSGMDEVLDCFLLDGPLADLPETARLQPCLEQLSVHIYHSDVNAVVGETSLSFALLNVHNRAEGARKHAAALRRLMVDIVSHPLSSQNLLGEASTSAVAFCVDDLDTDEDLGSVVCMPHLEDPRFEILP